MGTKAFCNKVEQLGTATPWCREQDPLELAEAARETIAAAVDHSGEVDDTAWEKQGLVEAGNKCLEKKENNEATKIRDCDDVVYISEYGGLPRLALNWLKPLKNGADTLVKSLLPGNEVALAANTVEVVVYEKEGWPVYIEKDLEYFQKPKECVALVRNDDEVVKSSRTISFLQVNKKNLDATMGGINLLSGVIMGTATALFYYGGPLGWAYYATPFAVALIPFVGLPVAMLGGGLAYFGARGIWSVGSYLVHQAYKPGDVGNNFKYGALEKLKTGKNHVCKDDMVRDYFKHVNCVKEVQYSIIGDGLRWLLGGKQGVIRQAEVCTSQWRVGGIHNCFKLRYEMSSWCKHVTLSGFLQVAHLLRKDVIGIAENLISEHKMFKMKILELIEKSKRSGKKPTNDQLKLVCKLGNGKLGNNFCDKYLKDQLSYELTEAFVVLLAGYAGETKESAVSVTMIAPPPPP